MKKLLLIVAISSLAFSVIAQPVDEEKRKLINELLQQTGQSATQVAQQFSDAFIQQLSGSLRQARPDIDPKAFTIMEDVVNQVIQEKMVDNNAMLDAMQPIYSKHFTAGELEQIIEFNSTPLGKKLIEIMPTISQEGMQVGQSIGMQMGPEIQSRFMQRLQDEGISL